MILINELLKNLKSRFNLNILHTIHIFYFTCYSSTLNMCYKNKETIRIFINKQNNSANKYNHRQQLRKYYLKKYYLCLTLLTKFLPDAHLSNLSRISFYLKSISAIKIRIFFLTRIV